MTSDKKINYIAIIETTLLNNKGQERTLFPEKIEGNTKDMNAVITLTGTYEDGQMWELEVSRKDIKSISYTKQKEKAE